MTTLKKQFRLTGTALALCLLIFLAFTPAPAQAADDLYIYSGGGGGGGGAAATSYQGGGGGGGYVSTINGGAGKGGDGYGTNSGGAGGGSGGSSLDGVDSTIPSGGAGGGNGAYAGSAGAGHGGSTGGAGGDGGSVINPTISDTEFKSLTIGSGTGGIGGAGYSSGIGGKGGNGGSISLTLGTDTNVLGNITLTSGNGGNSGSGVPSNLGGDGGNGGSISLGASGSLTVNGDITLTSGSNGAAGGIFPGQGGTGGGVYFGYSDAGITASTYTLVFADNSGAGHNVSLTKGDGAAYFNATGLTLDAGAAGAVNTVSFTGVDGYDAFTIGDISLGGYSALQIDATSLNYNWSGRLHVNGNSNSLQNISGGTDLSGRIVVFNLANDLTAGDTLLTGSNTKLTGTSIAMAVASVGGQPGTLNSLNTGDQITLISGIDQSTWSGSQSQVTTSGGAIDYTFALGTEQQGALWSLTSTLQGENFDDGKAHNALMSASALSLLLTQGADRAASLPGKFTPSGQSLGQSLGQAGNVQYGFYMDMGGGHYEMKTGSHVESDSFHLLAGPGLRVGHEDGAKTDLGLFFEAGWGNFDTYNSFYRGDGNTSYYGAGLLARHDLACGLYGEASLRLGHAKSEYDSDYTTGYDISSNYYGGHLGFGYILPVSEPGSLDFSAKLLYTRLEGDTDTNSAGDRMKVGGTDSLRTQLGMQYNHKLADSFTAFGKVAWDYEFDGETTGRYNRYRISKTDPSGSTGIGEIGLKWQVADTVSINLSGHGLVGQRKGYGGNLGFRLEF